MRDKLSGRVVLGPKEISPKPLRYIALRAVLSLMGINQFRGVTKMVLSLLSG